MVLQALPGEFGNFFLHDVAKMPCVSFICFFLNSLTLIFINFSPQDRLEVPVANPSYGGNGELSWKKKRRHNIDAHLQLHVLGVIGVEDQAN